MHKHIETLCISSVSMLLLLLPNSNCDGHCDRSMYVPFHVRSESHQFQARYTGLGCSIMGLREEKGEWKRKPVVKKSM